MMMRARGPVWHRQHQQQGLIPAGLPGLDTEATWSDSKSDGWVYGHGTFGMVAWTRRILGAFKWMRNITTVLMDSKADEKELFRELRRQRGIRLLTTPRKGSAISPERQRMVKVLKQKRHQHLYQQRRYTVEPMQGLIKDLFALETCWMRGQAHNRWLFAAMGVLIQMHQYRAWQEGRSTWAIKQEVLGQ